MMATTTMISPAFQRPSPVFHLISARTTGHAQDHRPPQVPAAITTSTAKHDRLVQTVIILWQGIRAVSDFHKVLGWLCAQKACGGLNAAPWGPMRMPSCVSPDRRGQYKRESLLRIRPGPTHADAEKDNRGELR